MSRIMMAAVLALCVPVAQAQEATPEETPMERQDEAPDGNSTGDLQKRWGFGIGLGAEFFDQEYIELASLQGSNRIVTIEKGHHTKPSAWLTGKWNIWPLSPWKDDSGNLIRQTSLGLFAGVSLVGADGNSFDALAFGPQVNFDLANNRSVSVGLGWVTHDTRGFASGIVDGQPLPEQYDNIVYREGTEHGWIFMLSYGL